MNSENPGRLDQAQAEWTSNRTIVFARHSPLAMPLNLGEWFPSATLAAWVREEVAKIAPAHAQAWKSLPDAPDTPPETMLCLLAFGYLTQVFRSREIVEQCHTASEFQSFCSGKPPFPEELEDFRRAHRPLLEEIIYGVLLRSLRERSHLSPDPLAPGLERNLRFRAQERLDIARHMNRGDE